MSYDGNKSHYTPRYNSSSSRKLHDQQSKTDSSKPSSSSTSSSTLNQPSNSYQSRTASNTTGGGSSETRRDYYIGSGYKSRYNDSYTSKSSSSHYGNNTTTNGSKNDRENGHRSSTSSYYTSNSSSNNVPVSASSIRRKNEFSSSSLSRYPTESSNSNKTGGSDKFITRSGASTSSYGSYRKDFNFKRQTTPEAYIKEKSPVTDPLSSFKDERRISNNAVKVPNSSTSKSTSKSTSTYIPTSRKSSWETGRKKEFTSSLPPSRKSSFSERPIRDKNRETFLKEKEKYDLKRSSLSSTTNPSHSKLNDSRKSSIDSIGSGGGDSSSRYDWDSRKSSLADKVINNSGSSKYGWDSRKSSTDDKYIKKEDHKVETKRIDPKSESRKKEEVDLRRESKSNSNDERISDTLKSKIDQDNGFKLKDPVTTLDKSKSPLSDEKANAVNEKSNNSNGFILDKKDDTKASQTNKPNDKYKTEETPKLKPNDSLNSSPVQLNASSIKRTSFNDYLKKSKEKKKVNEENSITLPELRNNKSTPEQEQADEDREERDKGDEKISNDKDENKLEDDYQKNPSFSEKLKVGPNQDEDAMEIDVIEKPNDKDSNKIVDTDHKETSNPFNETKDTFNMLDDDGDTEMKDNEEQLPSVLEANIEEQKRIDPEEDTKIEDDHNAQNNNEKLDLNMTAQTNLQKDDYFTDSSILSPIHDSQVDKDFTMSDLGPISESQTNDDREHDKDYEDKSNLSETETLIGTPPRLNHGRNLIKKTPIDNDRHLLKRKKTIVDSSDEEIDNKEDIEEDNEFSTNKKETKSKSDKKLLPGKSMKKTPYKIKRDSSGRSLLQRACKKGSLEDVKEYISRGANANEKDFCGFTCLHEAALEGHSEIVQYLIDHGANVNAKADEAGDSETPLIDAAENKHLETVKILLKNNADPTIFNIDGFTALTKIYNEHADEEGYDEIIQALEEANNKITNRQISHGRSKSESIENDFVVVDDPNENYFAELIKRKGIFKWAAENQKELVANHFVSGNSLEDKPDILIIAARNGHSELIDIALGLNPTQYNIDTENSCGVTALLSCVGRGQIEVVKSLLTMGADPFKIRKKDGLNALQIAEHSSKFNLKEIELIKQYMEKKSGTKIISTVSSRVTSRITSKPSSRAPSVPVSDESEEEVEKELKENEDKMDIDQENHNSEPENENEKYMNNLEVKKIRSNQSKTDLKKNKSTDDIRKLSDSKLEMKKVKSNEDDKKRKHIDSNDDDQHPLKKSKSTSVISNLKHNVSSGKDKSNTETPTVHKERSNSFYKPPVSQVEKSLSPASVSTTATKPVEKAKSPPPLTPAQEELKLKNAEEARIWQEKAEAKKKARKEMFLKIEKEKELKKKEEEEKKAEEIKIEEEKKDLENNDRTKTEDAIAKSDETISDELKENTYDKSSIPTEKPSESKEVIDVVQNIPKKIESTDTQQAKENKNRVYQFYPTGLRKIKFNSKPTTSSISKYAPLYIFIIDDEKYVLDLQLSLITLTPISNLEFQNNNLSNSIIIENEQKSKLWKLFKNFIGTEKNDKNLFYNLSIKFVKYEDTIKLIENQFPFVYENIKQKNKSVEVLLDDLTGFDDDVKKSTIDLVHASNVENLDNIEILKFIPPHLSYRKDIVNTIKSTNNPLW
ncbi:uncharacterized protein KGF55_002553 [Candida pseudojiufengensis]|uniref:uncharacterized protein n=1 Tax=Candida pseudojiufengensis TaxID=497109 RepID=UPI002225A397|nr:uncharacterized protein KGF55_002553 [Candida pseudojiufengensis]KAI5963673.1 hypothetical protein KGF55_002553 [Candida pseudojiufengensis]